VAAGHYTETIEMDPWESIEGGWNSDFSQRWGFEQNGVVPSALFETTIDGNNSGRCVTITDAENVSIDGFTIQNGNLTSGAGVYINSNGVTVRNSIIKNNTASSEGGGIDDDASSIISNCYFESNASNNGGGLSTGDGTIVENCIFKGNEAEFGGGIFGDHQYYTLTNSIFYQNRAYRGGGIFNVEASPKIENCIFNENSFIEDFTGTYVGGGGVFNESSSPEVVNCTFINNAAGLYGGGMCNFYSSSPTVKNSIFWENSALTAGDQIYNDSTPPTISYCDIEASGGSGINWDSAIGVDAGGNIDLDPLFVDPEGHNQNSGIGISNLHLGYGSPCINSGTTEDTEFNDMGAFPAVTVGNSSDFATVDEALENIKTHNQGGSILISSGNHPTDRMDINGAGVSILGEDKNSTTLFSNNFGGIDITNANGHLENLRLHYGTWVDNSHAVLKNCIVETGSVGVFFLGNNSTSSGLVQNCIFTNNEDAIRIYRSSNPIWIVNNTISHNSGLNGGTGIYLMDTSTDSPVPPQIINNIISDNSRYGIYEDYWNVESIDAEVSYNCFFNNSSGDYHDHTQAIYTGADQINQLVDNGMSIVDNNISVDPMFVDMGGYDFHLSSSSPAIDAGDDSAFGSLSTDFEGDLRVFDGNLDCIATADIGADEYVPNVIVPPAPVDLKIIPGYGYIDLQWDAPSCDGGDPIVSYNIFRRDEGQSYNLSQPAGIVPVTSTNYRDLNEMNGITYYYSVTATNSIGNMSALSIEVSFVPTDTDQDGIDDEIETTMCTNPYDADTDDDGIMDGNEDTDQDGIVDPDESDPCLADTDGDGIYDGTEIGLITPQNVAATNLSAGYFIADANPATTTDPNNPDTDGDNIHDGLEDVNHNGDTDACEPDPTTPTTDIAIDLDADGDVDGLDLASHIQAIGAGTSEMCLEVFSAYLGLSTTLPADPDNDGILSDGNFSGIVGDFSCPDGITIDCDDNCPNTNNPTQDDFNGDGIGDACTDFDPCDPNNPYFDPSQCFDCDPMGNLGDSPVCGTDGITYLSSCRAQWLGVGIAYEGNCQYSSCTPPIDIDCFMLGYQCVPFGSTCIVYQCQPIPYECPSMYLPVCGCDGYEYGNECQALQAGVGIVNNGPCFY
jgi:hypothetical protein